MTENALIKTAIKDTEEIVDLEKHAPELKSVNFSMRNNVEKIMKHIIQKNYIK